MRTKTYAACSGCSLCLLSCPVWHATRDIRLTPHGRAKAMQHGASALDLKESVDSCTLCGACEPVCPENIGLMDMIKGLRRELAPHSAAIAQSSPNLTSTLRTLSALRGKLGSGDLYVIAAPAYHARHAQLVQHYDALRLATGCMMNLDLQRMAITTGAASQHSGRVDAEEQARWILEGRSPSRIVVEDAVDIAVFRRVAGVPVFHLSELIHA